LGGLCGVEVKRHRAVVKASEVQQVIHLAWRGDGHAGTNLGWFRPINFASLRVQRVDGFGVPDDELSLAAGGEKGRGAISWFLGGEAAPDFLAVIFVERNRGGVRTTHEADEPVSVQERTSRKTPQRCGNAVIFLQCARPNDLAVLCVQTEQIAFA